MKSLLALVLLLAPQVETPARDGSLVVHSTGEGGERVYTLSCDNVPLRDVLDGLAAETASDVDGFRDEWKKLLVTVDLRRRPLRQVLAYVLGSVDLAADVRQGAIYVHTVERSNDPEVLREIAVASYQRALREFPEHELGPLAEKRLGELEEARGDRAAARRRYGDLIERHPDSDLTPGAMLRLGQLLVEERSWSAAAVRFEDLLRYPRPHAFQLEARTELLRCLAHTGDFTRALNLVDDLDLASPATTLESSVDRRLLRARCLAGLKRGKEALDVLDSIAQATLDGEGRRDYLEVRAVACESEGRADEAARSWLSYGCASDGADRVRGFEAAARLALASDDALGVLCVEKLAKKEHVDSAAIDEAARKARESVALDNGANDAPALVQRVERGERLIAAGLNSEAFDLLRGIGSRAAAFAPAERARYARAYARSLAAEINVDAAVALLRDTLAFVSAPDERKTIYVLAGELLEADGRLDEAVEAYCGRL